MSNSYTKVSVIVPVFNVETYLKECLDSLAHQTYTNVEIIMVNDGSTDTSRDVCEEYSDNDSRFLLINKPNEGVSAARNTGLARITGDYFTYVDSDDIVSDDYIETLLTAAQCYNLDMVCARVKMIYSSVELETANTNPSSPEIFDTESAVEKLLYLKGIDNYVVSKIYKTLPFRELRFDTDISIGEDMEYLFRGLKLTTSVGLLNSSPYFYRQRLGSAMNQPFSLKRVDACIAAEKILSHPELTQREKAAAETKLFSESLTLAASTYDKRGEYPDIYRKHLTYINQLSKRTMFNSQARIVTRMYAAISMVNIRLAMYFAHIKRRMILRRAL